MRIKAVVRTRCPFSCHPRQNRGSAGERPTSARAVEAYIFQSFGFDIRRHLHLATSTVPSASPRLFAPRQPCSSRWTVSMISKSLSLPRRLTGNATRSAVSANTDTMIATTVIAKETASIATAVTDTRRTVIEGNIETKKIATVTGGEDTDGMTNTATSTAARDRGATTMRDTNAKDDIVTSDAQTRRETHRKTFRRQMRRRRRPRTTWIRRSHRLSATAG